ncbi:MAG: S-layer homology domain-containing protein [Clostridia bacterium]|nr:S-layer homology domain-containing protein [Clostridia bacterium]
MNKNVFKAALCTALLACTTSQAAIVDKIQPEGSRVYVNGSKASSESVYSVTVVKKGADLNKLTEIKPDVYYQGEITANKDGVTELMFKMPSRSVSGDYILRVHNGKAVDDYEFYYMSSQERQSLIDRINSGIKTEISDVLTNNSDDLGLYLAAEAKIDISGVVERVYNKVTGTQDYKENPVFTEETFIKAYKEYVVLEAFAQKKSEFLIKDGSISYNEYTNIDKSSLYYEYQNSLSENGINYVNNGVTTEGCTSWAETAGSFDKNTAYAVICRYKDDGYGHVNDKLQAYKEIFKNKLLIDFTYYDYLTPDEKITFARELNVKNIADSSQLKSRIEDTAKNIYGRRVLAVIPGGAGGSGGSGGGGGGTANLNVNVSAATSTPSGTFKDLYSVEWARTSVEYLAGKNIVCGKAEGLFYPDDSITREEFMKIICLAFNVPTDGAASDFNDVNKNEWYYPYVSALYNLGVISGVDETNFGTGMNITREQMAVVMARILNIKSSYTEKFSDDYDISDYAKDAVYAMRERGIINGVGNNLFYPKGIATRAEAAKIVYSAMTNL